MRYDQSSQDFIQLFDINVDIRTRTMYLGSLSSSSDDSESGVDHNMSSFFIKGLHTLESDNKKPISVLMNNPGGDWYHGMAIYDAITCSPCKITIRAYGQAMSMGSIILQAADYREMMPNTRFMMHYGQDGAYGHSKTIERWADESKRISYRMEEIYLDKMMEKSETSDISHAITSVIRRLDEFQLSKSNIPKVKLSRNTSLKREELRKILRDFLIIDTILTPTETIDLGFADEVVEINKKNKTR